MAERATVLLAEDDPDSRRIMAHLLERSNYEVLIARDGAEALGLVDSRVQIALIDWMMPGVDGVEVCRRLKAATGGSAYVIMVTAKTEKADIVHALDAGADDYMTKPVDHGELLARVRAAERVAARERDLARACSEARSEAERDALTGLCTRRVFDQALAEVTAPPRSGPLSLLMIDLDHFKRVNDTHGHQVGDEVLREVARAVMGAVRADIDVAARYGGEEFAVIAVGVDAEGAEALAERIRRRVARARVLTGKCVVSVTVSIGVATPGTSGDEADGAAALVARADRRLYEAKRGGRNQVAA